MSDQASVAVAPTQMFAGTPRFQLLACLGRGSMGVVYRVHDAETDSDVALKTFGTRTPEQLYQLKQEFRVLTGIAHPNLVELYELVVDEHECFFTMELVDGVDFVAQVRAPAPATKPIDLARFRAATRQLVHGLAAVHAAGRLHRDIKPSNVLVTRAGRVVLLDFGLATVLGLDELPGSESHVAGTFAYMAPELAWGQAPTPAADWYSMGVMLYEALTGKLPFTGPPAKVLQQKSQNAPPPPSALAPDIPVPLDALITTLLQPDPAHRPSAVGIALALTSISENERPETAHEEWGIGPRPNSAFASSATPVSRFRSSIASTGSPGENRSPAPGHTTPFVGRTAELAQLDAIFGSVCGGHAAVVHLFGPSGIGKSELVRRFLARVEQDGPALVLRGRCHPQEAVPYKAVDRLVDALSRVLIALPETEAAALVPPHVAALTRLFPVLGRVPALANRGERDDAAEPHEVRRRGFGSLRAVLSALARRQPLVLWIDDLQWGDLDSAALLRALLRPPDAPAMLVLLSYRSEDRAHVPLPETPAVAVHDEPAGGAVRQPSSVRSISADANLLEGHFPKGRTSSPPTGHPLGPPAVGESPCAWVHEIELGPLDARETRDLAAQLCAAQIESDGRIAEIVAESAGSPFFVGELARWVSEENGLPFPQGEGQGEGIGVQGSTAPPLSRQSVEPTFVPLRLADVMHGRFQQLVGPAREVLEVVAVAGGPVLRSVALSAAGMGERGRPIVQTLEQRSLLRATTVSDHAAVEVYHDRIREALIAQLAPTRLRDLHCQIAETLRLQPDADPHALFTHYLGAGDTTWAGHYAILAGDSAARALAFDRAAQLYRQALELRREESERPTLLAKLAEALANGGRGAEAGASYEAAAAALSHHSPNRREILALRRRAAEQYLRVGGLDRGLAATQSVLTEIGIPFRATPGRALTSAIFRRTLLGIQRWHRRLPVIAESIPAETLLRLEACWGTAMTLTPMDQVVADALCMRHLSESLASGARSHIVRAFGVEITKRAQMGGPLAHSKVEMLRQLEALVRDSRDPYEQAWPHFARGASAYQEAAWGTAHDECQAGVAILRGHCTGVTWEIVTFECFALSALAHMGELQVLSQQLPQIIADAETRSDLYAAIGFRAGVLNLTWLAQDRPEYARHLIDEALARWPTAAGFHVQHYLHLIAAMHADLYLGNVWVAWRRIEDAWPKLRRSLLLAMEGPAVELHNLRARAALAVAHGATGLAPNVRTRARLLRLAAKDAGWLARRKVASARPFASAIRAGVVRTEDRDAAAQLYAEAAQGFEATGMRLYWAAARHHEGALRGGEPGQQLQREGIDWMRSQDIKKPRALMRIFCPGVS